MFVFRFTCFLFLGLAPLLLNSRGAAAQVSSADCALCHGGDDPDIPAVTDSLLSTSIHSGFSCLDCHASITDLPHPDRVERVQCGTCHEEEAAIYQWHGPGKVGTTPDIPGCADCHGTHNILPSSDRGSSVNPTHLPATCGRCHEDLDLARKHDIRMEKPVEVYEASIHGQASMGGVSVSATCTDCHSTGGTAHRILPPGNAESSVNHFNIPHTCGKCHNTIEEEYWEGIHGKLAARGETDTPVCTHCHGEHGILRVNDPRSPVSPTQVAEATCAPCHESASLNEKYGIPAGRLASFIDSYHGLKSRAGDTEVANCASCHGAHRILPSSDPSSSINPNNLQHTCGDCHPGISAQMATMKIHETGTGLRTGWPHYITVFYVIFIFAVIGTMVLHALIDLRKRFKDVVRLPQVRRMTSNDMAQHWALLITFLVLVTTGFALRYSEAGVFRLLFGWDGGFHVRGVIHRAAGTVFLLTCVWHVLYLRTKPGRRFLRDMWPGVHDFRQFGEMIAYNVERRRERPRFGRFSYMEKAEYWALVWGAVIMGVTGLLLWFDNAAVKILHKGVLDIMLIIHHYEAWLAFLAILVWHMYSTIFNPTIYPGNPSWLTGKMPRAWHEHEHPAEAEPSSEPPRYGQGRTP